MMVRCCFSVTILHVDICAVIVRSYELLRATSIGRRVKQLSLKLLVRKSMEFWGSLYRNFWRWKPAVFITVRGHDEAEQFNAKVSGT